MIQLRPYQQTAVDNIRHDFRQGKRKIILCAPTGAGKTIMFSYITQSAIKRNSPVLIITDRIELLTQAQGSLVNFNLHAAILTAGSKEIPTDMLVVAMAETIKRRLGSAKKKDYLSWLKSFSLIIIDEAHKQSFSKIIDNLESYQYLIGATATPSRKGRAAKQLSEHYDSIITTLDIPELIEQGYLSSPDSYGNEIDLSNVRIDKGEFLKSDLSKVYGKLNTQLLDNYEKHAKGLKTVLFAASVANSKAAKDEFIKAGYVAFHIDGETPIKERREILAEYKNTNGAILCNANIVNTGWDEPSVQCVILYRATTSLSLFLQMVGRGSRVTDNKNKFTILDFGNNIQRFGFWEAPRSWSLSHNIAGEGIAPTKFCPHCDAIIQASAKVCDYCGGQLTVSKKVQLMELKKLTRDNIQNELEKAIKNKSWESLENCIEAMNYRQTWAIYKLASNPEALRSYTKFKGWTPFYVKKILKKKF